MLCFFSQQCFFFRPHLFFLSAVVFFIPGECPWFPDGRGHFHVALVDFLFCKRDVILPPARDLKKYSIWLVKFFLSPTQVNRVHACRFGLIWISKFRNLYDFLAAEWIFSKLSSSFSPVKGFFNRSGQWASVEYTNSPGGGRRVENGRRQVS